MRLDRANADDQAVGDLLVGVAERQEREHLPLAIRQRVVGLPAEPASATSLRAEGRMDVLLAGRDPPDRRDQLRVGGLLEHVTDGAVRERLPHVRRIVLHREHQDPRRRQHVPDLGGGVHSGGSGHDDVHEHDVGLELAGHLHGPVGVARLADGLHVLLTLEQQPQPGPHDRMVVDDQYSDHSGTSTAMVVPRRDVTRPDRT